MSGSEGLNSNIPIPSVPVFDIVTGILNQAWYRFFLSVWLRSGGAIGVLGVPGGIFPEIQFNNNGQFGGLSDIELTARVQLFNATLSGAVVASGGDPTKFLNALNAFAVPQAAGPAGGDLGGTYPDPGVLQVHGVAYPASPATGTVPVVTGSDVVTYTATTGTGNVVRAAAATMTGLTVTGGELVDVLNLGTASAGARIITGTGAPAGTVSASTLYIRSDGSVGAGLYFANAGSAYNAVSGV